MTISKNLLSTASGANRLEGADKASGSGFVAYFFLFIASILFAYGLSYADGFVDVREGGFIGPDSLTRVLWVQQLVTDGGWFDATLDRFNTPFGMSIHWTRPMDIVILVTSFPIHWLTGMPIEEAVATAGLVVSPMLASLAIIAYAIVLRHFGLGAIWLLMPALFVLQPTLAMQFAWGRPDHHSLQLLGVAIIIAAIAVVEARNAERCGLAAALAVLLSVWVSPEGLIPATFTFGFLALAAALTRSDPLSRLSRAFVFWLLWLTPAALLIERGITDVLTPASERFSVLQGLFLALGAGGVWLFHRFGHYQTYKTVHVLGLGAYAAASVSLVLATGIVRLSHKDYIDPRTRDILFDNNREFVPLLSSHFQNGDMVLYLASAIVALACLAAFYWRARLSDEQRLALGWIFLATLFYTTMALFVSVRWAAYAQMIGFLVFCAVLHLVLTSISNSLVKIAVFGALILLPIGGSFAGAARTPQVVGMPVAAKTCHWPSAAVALAAVERTDEGRRTRVLATIFRGPEIAWFADVDVVAGPYAQPEPLIDTYKAFTAASFAAIQEVVERRQIDAVIVCHWDGEEAGLVEGQTVHKRLQAQTSLPAWLRPLNRIDDLPDHGLLVYQVSTLDRG